jgi:dTDP-4-amino-4,6-dideoxygalactose transaminase
VAESIVERMMSLPIYAELSNEEVAHVIRSIRAYYKASRGNTAIRTINVAD